MSFVDFQSKYASVMESMLKSAVEETTKLFEALVDELKEEISRVKKENDDLKTRCSQYERATVQASGCGGRSGAGQAPGHSWEKRDRGVQCDLTSSCTEMVQNVEQRPTCERLRYCLHDHNYEQQAETYYLEESSPAEEEFGLKKREESINKVLDKWENENSGPHRSRQDIVTLVANDTQMGDIPGADPEHLHKQMRENDPVPAKQLVLPVLEGEQPVPLQQCSEEQSETDQTVVCQENGELTEKLVQTPTERNQHASEEQPTTTRTTRTQMVYPHLVKSPKQEHMSSSPKLAKHVQVTSEVSTGDATQDETRNSKQGKVTESETLGSGAPSPQVRPITDTFIYSSVKSQKPFVKTRQRCTSVTLQDAMLLVEAMSPNVSSSLFHSHTQMGDRWGSIAENVATDLRTTAPSTAAHEVEDTCTSSKTLPEPNGRQVIKAAQLNNPKNLLSTVPGNVTYITSRKLLPVISSHENRTLKDQVKLIIIQKKSTMSPCDEHHFKSIPHQSETVGTKPLGSELLSSLICLSGDQLVGENAKPVEVPPVSPFELNYVPVDKVNSQLNCGPQQSHCPTALEFRVNSQDAPTPEKTAEASAKSAEIMDNVHDYKSRLNSLTEGTKTAGKSCTLSLNSNMTTETCDILLSESTVSTTTCQSAVEAKLSPVVKLCRLPIWVNTQETIFVPSLSSICCPGRTIPCPTYVARSYKNPEEESCETWEVDLCPTSKLSSGDHAYHLNKENEDAEEEKTEQDSIPSNHSSYPQSRMTKTQFLAQLEATPTVEPGKKVSTDGSIDEKASDYKTFSSDGQGLQKDSMMTRLRSHLRNYSQIRKSQALPSSGVNTTTVGLEKNENATNSDDTVTETTRPTETLNTTSLGLGCKSENNIPITVDSQRLRKRPRPYSAHRGCAKKEKRYPESQTQSPKKDLESSSKGITEHVNGNVCSEEIMKTSKKLQKDPSIHTKKIKVVNSKKSVKSQVLAKMTSSNECETLKAGKKCKSTAVWIPPVEKPANEKTLLPVAVKKESTSQSISVGFASGFPALKLPPMVSPLQPLSVIGGRLLKNQCGECGRILSSPAALESHVSLHTGHRPFSCSNCGKRFPDSKSLKRHNRVHRNGRIHVCQECGKGFVYRFILTKHLEMVHSRIKPFVCPMCAKGFFTRRDVEAHIRSHTGEKPFQCNLCGKKFNRKVELNVHLRWHYGEKRYWCSYCEKGFLDLNNLKRHKYIHTGEKPHACPHCPKHFTQSGHLKKHVKNVHKVQ